MVRKTKAENFDALVIKGQPCPKRKKYKIIEQKKVLAYFVSRICRFANGGGYIPCSDEYDGKKVYVVVLMENTK